MKRFFVAAFCTLLMSGSSLMAQEAATNVAPVAPVEDVAVAPVAQTAVTGSVVAGCNNCGSVVAPSYAPMTYTMQDAGVPVASGCGCSAPVTSCCDPCDPCAGSGRQGFLGKRRARRAARRGGYATAY
jgi:hypothetical protein